MNKIETKPTRKPTKVSDRKSKYWPLLNQIIDPEVGIGIVDLGLIYHIDINKDNEALVRMTLTSPSCPVGPVLIQQVQDKMILQPEINGAEVELVWDPIWNNNMIDEEIRDMMM
jgi:metal-sulfur cluster biosynthetic enzyme